MKNCVVGKQSKLEVFDFEHVMIFMPILYMRQWIKPFEANNVLAFAFKLVIFENKTTARIFLHIYLVGSVTALNSNVPTVVDANKGVKMKWFRGETIVMSK